MRTLFVIAFAFLAHPVIAATPPLREWRITSKEARFERYLGRDAIVLQNGGAWLDTASFRDGVITYDVAAPADRGFHGVAFRAVDESNFENFYLRWHQSGNPDASQYQPVFNGVSGWQIYTGPRYSLPVSIASDRWIHVELRVRDRRCEVFVDGQRLVFPELVRTPVAGGVGILASGAPARFANVVIQPGEISEIDTTGAPAVTLAPSGSVMRWRVSTTFAETGVASPGTLQWDVLDSGDTGIANLATLRRRTPERNTVFAAVMLRARKQTVVRARFGFSDRVVVLLDRRELYRGHDEFQSRDYRFLGSVGLYDEVVLHLDRGEHELWFAVSETFGGWAVALQLIDGADVEVIPPR